MAFLCSLFSVMGSLNHGCYRLGNGEGKNSSRSGKSKGISLQVREN